MSLCTAANISKTGAGFLFACFVLILSLFCFLTRRNEKSSSLQVNELEEKSFVSCLRSVQAKCITRMGLHK